MLIVITKGCLTLSKINFSKPEKDTDGTFTTEVLRLVEEQPTILTHWLLLLGYAYYHHDISLVSDEAFDMLMVRFGKEYNLQSHTHKHMITEDMVKTGSLFNIVEADYPVKTKISFRYINDVWLS